jgi:hypothetical protein
LGGSEGGLDGIGGRLRRGIPPSPAHEARTKKERRWGERGERRERERERRKRVREERESDTHTERQRERERGEREREESVCVCARKRQMREEEILRRNFVFFVIYRVVGDVMKEGRRKHMLRVSSLVLKSPLGVS